MKELQQVQDEITRLVSGWESRLAAIDPDILHGSRNSQDRTIKQIVGHLVDSASNNLHRIVHLQYQPSPLQFPDYANLGNNDRWIAVQKYQEEEWPLLVQLWKFTNLHLAHVIGRIEKERLGNIWISALGEEISLLEMVVDYPRHLKLHLGEIEELLHREGRDARTDGHAPRLPGRPDMGGVEFYRHKLLYEIDSWDLVELRRNDPFVVVVDTRPKEIFDREHIPGAMNFPHRTINPASTRDLDPAATYVTYCDGIGCNASTKGALKLAELGFSTRELQGGLDWWKRDGYPTEGENMTAGSQSGCNCA